MKSTTRFLAGLSILLISSPALWGMNDNHLDSAGKGNTGDTVKIVSSPELMGLAQIWKDEYSRINPDVPFKLIGTNENRATGINTIYFLTGDREESPGGELNWKIVIGHNAIVPFINKKNPMADIITVTGVTGGKLASLLDSKESIAWNGIVENGMNTPVSVFVPDNPAITGSLKDFTGSGNDLPFSVLKENPQSVISAVEKDIYSVGFCRLSDLMNPQGDLHQSVCLLPIDKNANGRIDSFESIYGSPESLIRGIWIGKYPHELCGSIFAAAKTRPEGENLTAFLSWVTTDGGNHLSMLGYSDLATVEKNLNLASIHAIDSRPETTGPKAASGLLILISFMVIAGIIVAVAVRSGSKKKKTSQPVQEKTISVFNERSIHAPAGLYYDKTHTWAFMERDGIVRVGIDDFMQHLTGKITRIVMREAGEFVRRGEKIVTIIQEGKQLILYAPVSGMIKSLNTGLFIDSSLLNTSPYADGWIYLIEPANWAREIQFMLMSDKFGEWIKNEFIRFKDFLAGSAKAASPAYAHALMQDGGELSDYPLEFLGPEVWEEFQTNFINTSK